MECYVFFIFPAFAFWQPVCSCIIIYGYEWNNIYMVCLDMGICPFSLLLLSRLQGFLWSFSHG